MKFKKYNNNKEQAMLHKKNIYSLLLYTLLMSSSHAHAIAMPDFLYFGKISQFICSKFPSFSSPSSYFRGWWLTKTEARNEFYNFNQGSRSNWIDIQNKMDKHNKEEIEQQKKHFENLNNESNQQFTAQGEQLEKLEENVLLLHTFTTSNNDHIINLNKQASFLHEAQKITDNSLKTLNKKTKETTILLQKNKCEKENLEKQLLILIKENRWLKNNFNLMAAGKKILEQRCEFLIEENEKTKQHCNFLLENNQKKDHDIEFLKNFIQQNYIKNGTRTITDKPTNNSFPKKNFNINPQNNQTNIIDLFKNNFNY